MISHSTIENPDHGPAVMTDGSTSRRLNAQSRDSSWPESQPEIYTLPNTLGRQRGWKSRFPKWARLKLKHSAKGSNATTSQPVTAGNANDVAMGLCELQSEPNASTTNGWLESLQPHPTDLREGEKIADEPFEARSKRFAQYFSSSPVSSCGTEDGDELNEGESSSHQKVSSPTRTVPELVVTPPADDAEPISPPQAVIGHLSVNTCWEHEYFSEHAMRVAMLHRLQPLLESAAEYSYILADNDGNVIGTIIRGTQRILEERRALQQEVDRLRWELEVIKGATQAAAIDY